MPQCPYYAAVADTRATAPDLLHAVLSNPSAWTTYLQRRTARLDAAIFVEGPAAPALLALMGGYGVLNGGRINASPSNRTRVVCIGWTQEEVDIAAADADSFALTVVATLRMSDNVLTET